MTSGAKTLIREVLTMAQKRTVNEEALTGAIVFFCTLVTNTITKLPGLYNKYDRQRTASDLKAEVEGCFGKEAEILSRLYGFHDGCPYSPNGVALLLEIDPKKVEQVQRNWIVALPNYEAIRIQNRRTLWLQQTPCKKCGVEVGGIHNFGCVEEECPYCHGRVWSCLCAYRILKLGWGGRTAKEWRALRKQHGGPSFDRSKHIRPLTSEEKRQWNAAVMKKGAVSYGEEKKFQ